MQQTRSCFCYSPAHGAAIIGIAFFIGSTVVSLMLVGLVVEWNEVLQTIEHNNGNGSEEMEDEEGDCEAPKFQSDDSSPFSTGWSIWSDSWVGLTSILYVPPSA